MFFVILKHIISSPSFRNSNLFLYKIRHVNVICENGFYLLSRLSIILVLIGISVIAQSLLITTKVGCYQFRYFLVEYFTFMLIEPTEPIMTFLTRACYEN